MSEASAPKQGSHQSILPRLANLVISNGQVGESLRTWAMLESYTTDLRATVAAEGEQIDFRNMLRKCGISISAPFMSESQETWKQWARGRSGQPGVMGSLSGWGSTHQMVVVRQTILCPTPAQKVHFVKSKERLTALHTSLHTGRLNTGKIDRLNIAVDAQHVLNIVKRHGSENGVGHSAYAATTAFYACMFTTSQDWRGKPKITCRPPSEVTNQVTMYASRLAA